MWPNKQLFLLKKKKRNKYCCDIDTRLLHLLQGTRQHQTFSDMWGTLKRTKQLFAVEKNLDSFLSIFMPLSGPGCKTVVVSLKKKTRSPPTVAWLLKAQRGESSYLVYLRICLMCRHTCRLANDNVKKNWLQKRSVVTMNLQRSLTWICSSTHLRTPTPPSDKTHRNISWNRALTATGVLDSCCYGYNKAHRFVPPSGFDAKITEV